jgi:replicative DNA helicase
MPDIEAEMALLGCMMLEPKVIPDVTRIIPEGCFRGSRLGHADLYNTLCYMSRTLEAIDLVTVRNKLSSVDLLDSIGGVEYLVELAECVPDAKNALHYARIVAKG